MSHVGRRELRLAYSDCIRRKRGTVNAIEFEINSNEKLENLYLELNSMTYTIGKSITFVLCNSQHTPYREVFAADFRDRVIHHLLIRRLENALENNHYINDCYACRKGKGTLYGARRCQEQLRAASQNGTVEELYILKGDLHNCFNSFNKEKMYRSMEQFVIRYFPNDRNLIFNLYLLKKIMFHCPQHEGNYIRLQREDLHKRLKKEKSLFNCDDVHGIAIGNLTSQTFANFFLSLIDKYVTEILGYEFYGRYVDDFFLIGHSKDKLMSDYRKICLFVQSLDLEVNRNKLYIQHYLKGVPFIGFFVHWNKLHLLNTTRSRLYGKLYRINVYLSRYDLDYKFIQKLQSTWNSYMGMILHTHSQCIIDDVYRRHPQLIEKMSTVYDFDKQHFVHIKTAIKEKEKRTRLLSFINDELDYRSVSKDY